MRKSKKLRLSSPWEETKNKIKHNFVHLTDYDLRYDEGKEHELLTRLGKKMMKSRREVRRIIESY